MDKIYDLLIDDNLLTEMPGDRPEEPAMRMEFNDFKIPTLPNIDEIIDETENEDQEELPYDAGLQALTDNEIIEDYTPVDTINDAEEDQQSDEDLNNDEEMENEEETENDEFDDDDFSDLFSDDNLFTDEDNNEEDINEENEENESESNDNEEEENGNLNSLLKDEK